MKTKGRLAREVNFPYKEKDTPCEMDHVPNDLGVAKLTSYVKVGVSYCFMFKQVIFFYQFKWDY